MLWFKERLVVPKREALKKKTLDEARISRYSIHPWSTKMYHDLRQQFWWTRMKHEAARYISECDIYRCGHQPHTPPCAPYPFVHDCSGESPSSFESSSRHLDASTPLPPTASVAVRTSPEPALYTPPPPSS
jgi:hypothetical protein